MSPPNRWQLAVRRVVPLLKDLRQGITSISDDDVSNDLNIGIRHLYDEVEIRTVTIRIMLIELNALELQMTTACKQLPSSTAPPKSRWFENPESFSGTRMASAVTRRLFKPHTKSNTPIIAVKQEAAPQEEGEVVPPVKAPGMWDNVLEAARKHEAARKLTLTLKHELESRTVAICTLSEEVYNLEQMLHATLVAVSKLKPRIVPKSRATQASIEQVSATSTPEAKTAARLRAESADRRELKYKDEDGNDPLDSLSVIESALNALPQPTDEDLVNTLSMVGRALNEHAIPRSRARAS